MVDKKLDEAAKLPPGTGQLDIYGFGLGPLSDPRFGLGVDYLHRLSPAWSVFGAGWGSYSTSNGLAFGAQAGLRARF